MNKLQKEIRLRTIIQLNSCEQCRLEEGCTQRVFGYGNNDAVIAIVGEAPGVNEDQKGFPFIGDAGRMLNFLLHRAGVRRQDVYVTNSVKCYPKNTTIKKDHPIYCRPYLIKELNAMKNLKCVIALGNYACQSLLDRSGITDLNGIGFQSKYLEKPITVVPLLHPAFLLRDWAMLDAQIKFIKRIVDFTYNDGPDPYETRVPNVIIVDTEKKLWQFLKKFEGKDFAIDIETKLTKWWLGAILCIGFACEKGQSWVLPYSEEVKEVVKKLTSNPNVLKIAHNIKYEINWLRHFEMPLVPPYYDTMSAFQLCDENTPHNLTFAATYYNLQYGKWDDLVTSYTTKKDPDFSQIPKETLYLYNGIDVAATFDLWKITRRHMYKERVYEVFDKISMPFVEVVADMEYEGIKIDTKLLHKYQHEYVKKEDKKLQEVRDLVDDQGFNPKSPKQLAEKLSKHLKRLTKTGRLSTDADVLEKLAEKGYELPQKVLDLRSLGKIRSTYMDGLEKLLDEQKRVHTSYNYALTVTGRLSSSDPNLQNIPRRRPGEANIRAFFTVDPGWDFISADLAQVEQRVIAFYSKDKNLLEIFRSGEDIHTSVASKILKKDPKDVLTEERAKAKGVVYGANYGRSAHDLGREYKMEVKEAQFFIDEYFESFPQMAEWRKEQHQIAFNTGVLTTPYGRKRRLTGHKWFESEECRGMEDQSEVYARKMSQINIRNMAYNYNIQSPSSDYLTKATIRIYREFKEKGMKSKVIMSTHDAIGVKSPKEETLRTTEIVKRNLETRLLDEEGNFVDILTDVKVRDRWEPIQ